MNGTAWLYDADTSSSNGSMVTVWEKQDHSRDRTEKARETKSFVRYNCISRTRTLLSFTVLYPNGKVESADLPYYQQSEAAIAPDSIAEAAMKAVCAATAR